MNNDIRVDII